MVLVLEANGIQKKFGNVEALRNISLNIKSGIIGFIGPNGSGKTTFINILVGLIKPTSGYVKCFGYDSYYESNKLREYLGVMLENEYYPGSLTGYELLKILSKFYDESHMDFVIKELSKTLGMYTHLNKKISTYSAGMKKKLGVLSAFLNANAKLIILDEPFSDLDLNSRVSLIDTISRLHTKFDVSFIISSHIFPDVESLCDQYVFIHKGEVRWYGTYSSILSDYRAISYEVRTDDNDSFYSLIRKLESVEEAVLNPGHVLVKLKEGYGISEIVRIAEENNIKIVEIRTTESPLKMMYQNIVGGEVED